MIETIKVDVVYFMMATDFEFEFNLGGCCHMRLLNGKAKDKKEYLNCLARAVSRSQIIISCGPIFGEDGLIKITAGAISRRLQTVDNKAYGITSDDNIEIIEGAVPLVTPEGYFGGCIIESGPQTIILLTENKMIRKSIMKTLIHPYIEEMSVMRSASNSKGVSSIPQATPKENIAVTNEQETKAEAETSSAQPAEEISEGEANEPDIAEEIEENRETEEPILEDAYTLTENIVTEPSDHKIEFDFSADDDISEEIAEAEIEPSDSDQNDLFVQESYETENKKGGKGINVFILIIAIILLAAILGICYFLVFLPMKNGVSTMEYIKQLFSTVSSTASV